MKQVYKILLPLIIAIAFVGGMFISRIGQQTQLSSSVQQENKLFALLELIDKKYADSVSQEALIEDLIPFILEKLDPHSSYIVPAEYNEIHDPINGSFEGIGIQFNVKYDTIVALQIIPGGPSEQIGLRAGDRIVKINDSIVAGIGITNNEVIKLLKGPKGTKVTVSILRHGLPKLIDFVITRDKIPIYSIDASYMLEPTIGYIKISRFSITTPEEFLFHISKLRNLGLKKVIIDLRENGGGALSSAIFLADEFLHKNELIVYTEGKAYKRKNEYASGNGTCQDLELAVLLNEFSASASEVFAGAIQDNDRGVIVGRRSFGKGFVNKDFMFQDSSTVRLTIQKFYSPSGRCIQKPYKDGSEAYNNELSNRLLHGELEEIDSITFPDSLKFKTKKGRTVYGGGGIMPEVFVPLDTTGYSNYFSNLVNKSIIYDFAFKYADENRDKLSQIKSIELFTTYLNKQNVIQDLINYAITKDVDFNKDDFEVSESQIITRLYAYIARTILGDDGFYPILQKDDSTIKAALEKLN